MAHNPGNLLDFAGRAGSKRSSFDGRRDSISQGQVGSSGGGSLLGKPAGNYVITDSDSIGSDGDETKFGNTVKNYRLFWRALEMKELIPQNLKPYNQAAKKKLLELETNSDYSETGLYILQLAEWALETGEISLTDSNLQELFDSLRELSIPDQTIFFEVIENEDFPLELDNTLTPAEMAHEILERVQQQYLTHS